jgi:hypothetical protein
MIQPEDVSPVDELLASASAPEGQRNSGAYCADSRLRVVARLGH